MADWFAFIITIGEEAIAWLGSMQIYGVSIAGIIVGFFILGYLIRTILVRL